MIIICKKKYNNLTNNMSSDFRLKVKNFDLKFIITIEWFAKLVIKCT